jgi:tetratricopeptide (TPR) repeat protein
MSRRSSLRKGFLLASTLVVLTGCAKERETSSVACPPEQADVRPVDQALLAWLSKARTLHHLADLAEEEGSIDQAIARLEELAGGTMPGGRPPEAAEVMADTYARIAELRTRRGDYERADQAVTSGLAYAPGATYFRGHLLEVRGLVYEKQSGDFEKAGRASEAKKAREKGLTASLEAVRIQDEVIRSTLGDAGGPTKRD